MTQNILDPLVEPCCSNCSNYSHKNIIYSSPKLFFFSSNLIKVAKHHPRVPFNKRFNSHDIIPKGSLLHIVIRSIKRRKKGHRMANHLHYFIVDHMLFYFNNIELNFSFAPNYALLGSNHYIYKSLKT